MKFTLIVPCYNGEQFVNRCLVHCFIQNRTDFFDYEVIFVDNESTDTSLEIVEKVKKQFPSLQVYTAKNKYKFSWQEPVEEGLKHATGDYITIISVDDVIHEDYLTNVYRELKKRDFPKCFQSAIIRIHPTQGTMLENRRYKDIEELKTLLLKHCAILTPTVFYHKTLYEDGLLTWNSEEFLGASDYDLYCQLVDKGVFIETCPDCLGYYYVMHKDQATWGMVQEKVQGNHIDLKIQNKWKQKWES